VISDAQQDVLHATGPVATRAGFYLAGGTAVAIQLGHRRSADLDWFTPRAIPDPMVLAAVIRDTVSNFTVRGTDAGTLHGQASGVMLSFLEYRYPALVASPEWPEYGCQLASLEDLACMKLSAIGSRGSKKDFIDIYALGRTRLALSEMLDLYRQKYGVQDVGHIVMSLSYFDDAEPEDMPAMLWDHDWSDIKRTIEGWVSEFVRGTAKVQTPRRPVR
jgi:hypothetical protein